MKVSEVIYRRKVLAVTFKSSYTLICFIGIIGILLLSILVSLCLGRYDVTPMEILKEFFTSEDHPFISTIIFNIRLPRIIIALLAGGVLTISGCTYQAVFRNPMVSPDILGVPSGADCGAAIPSSMSMSSYGIQIMSFLCGLIAGGLPSAIRRVRTRAKVLVRMRSVAGC